MPLVQQQGQLVNTDGATTDQLAKLQGQAVTPTTPAGVSAIGGNPDQSKMAGTPNQQTNALNQTNAGQQQEQPVAAQSNGQDTLDQATRTEGAREQASDTEERAQQKATQLQSLGSLQTRVQALINNDLTLKNPAAAQTSGTKIQALPPADQAQAQQLIQSIAQNPNDPQAVAAATQFWLDKGWGTIDSFSPDQFLATAQETLGSQAEQQVQQTTGGQVTLKDVGLSADETTQLIDVFGDDSWQGLTVPQLNQRIEDMRQQEFNKAGALKDELANSQGTERQAVLSQLKDLGQVGVTGTEQSVQDLNQQVAKGDTVKIGGADYKVEDLLKDQAVTDLVTKMLGDKGLAAQVAQSNPDFAKWVSDNAASLQQISGQAASTMGNVRTINQQTQDLAKVGNTTLSDSVMQSVIANWGKIQSSVPDPSKSGIYQAVKNPDLGATTQQSMANALNRVASSDPETMKALTGMDATGVTNSYQDAQVIKSDSTGLLQELAGADKNPDFITDQAQQQAISQYKPVIDALNSVSSSPGVTGALNDPATHDALIGMIKSGQFTTKDAQLLASNPTGLKDYVTYHQTFQKLQTAAQNGDIGTVLDTVFGHGVDPKALQAEYDQAIKIQSIDPNSAGAQVAREFAAALDPNHTGKIDLDAIMGQEGKTYGGSLEDILSGGAPRDQLQGMLGNSGAWSGLLSGNQSPLYTQLSAWLNKGDLTYDEISSLDDAGRAQAEKLSGGKLTEKGYNDYQTQQRLTKEQATGQNALDVALRSVAGGQSWNDWSKDIYGTVFTNGKPLSADQVTKAKDLQSALVSQLGTTTGAGRDMLQQYINGVGSALAASNSLQAQADAKASADDARNREQAQENAGPGGGLWGKIASKYYNM